MSTTLELAREIRDHIVHHSTGRLNITFPEHLKKVDFSGGTIVTAREDLLRCLDEAPVRYEFVPMEIPQADEVQSGAALLVEALESIDEEALRRIWDPYRNWTIQLSQDPDIHRTPVADHLEGPQGRLRRLLRLAVTGAVTLGPPARRSLQEEMEAIRTATARENYWEALGVDRTADRPEIKRAHRELARQFHPDRWHAAGGRAVQGDIEQAFRDVQYCYEKAIAALPRQLAAVPPIDPTPAPAPPTAEPVPEPAPRTPPRVTQPNASAVAGYSAGSEEAPETNSLFRRIFDKFFKAA